MTECIGCGHTLSNHFRAVDDQIYCIVTEHGVSDCGILGIPYHRRCDCVNYRSESAESERRREATERERRDRVMQDIVDHARSLLSEPEAAPMANSETLPNAMATPEGVAKETLTNE